LTNITQFKHCGQEEWGAGHDAFTTGCKGTKALFGDRDKRRQEGEMNTTISQKRDEWQKCQPQRRHNRQPQASAAKGQKGGTTVIMQWRGIMSAVMWSNKEPS
jgi:hypothetical protein